MFGPKVQTAKNQFKDCRTCHFTAWWIVINQRPLLHRLGPLSQHNTLHGGNRFRSSLFSLPFPVKSPCLCSWNAPISCLLDMYPCLDNPAPALWPLSWYATCTRIALAQPRLLQPPLFSGTQTVFGHLCHPNALNASFEFCICILKPCLRSSGLLSLMHRDTSSFGNYSTDGGILAPTTCQDQRGLCGNHTWGIHFL